MNAARDLLRGIVPHRFLPSRLIRAQVVRATDNRVYAGPFRGMSYAERSVWGAHTPKLLGTYEREIHGALESAIARRPSVVLNIGGAEGYYAVGLALRLPDARVVAYEQMQSGRDAIAGVAALNGVQARIRVEGPCSPAVLRSELDRSSGRVLIVSDVEGYEIELLDSERLPELLKVDMLVEVHDTQAPGCSAALRRRFERSHGISHYQQRRRPVEEYPFRDVFRRFAPGWIEKYALNEFRSAGTSWMWMKAKD